MSIPYVCPLCRHYGLDNEELTYNSYKCPFCSRRYHKTYLYQTPLLVEELTKKQYNIEIYIKSEDGTR